jgi:hypothetical protein
MISITPIDVTEDNFRNYGNLFTDFSKEIPRINRWPKHPRGFREVHDGVSGGYTEGSFSVEWVTETTGQAKLHVVNDSVADGDYCFAETEGPEDAEGSLVKVYRELNHHCDGSQMFFCETHEIYLLLCENNHQDPGFPDHVDPTKFVCFKIPKGIGAHINSYIWHCPPMISPKVQETKFYGTKVQVFTKQGRVHSKIYYDPVEEHRIVFGIKILYQKS